MRYHILHVKSGASNFHVWDVAEDFVIQIVRNFLRGISDLRINGEMYQIGNNLLIYENSKEDGVGGVLLNSMHKIDGVKSNFNRDFFERKFRNVTDRFIQGRSFGELKDDFYNLYINDSQNKFFILALNEQEVQDFLNKWAAGESPIWISGRRIDLDDPKSIKVYDISLDWLSKDRGVIKFNIKKYAKAIHGGSYNIDTLEHFGNDVTDRWNIKPYSKIKTKPSSFDWGIIHSEIHRVAHPRFYSGHFADAVEAAFKELNDVIKKEFMKKQEQEDDGVSLMRQAFRPSSPVFKFNNLKSETDKSIQDGYMQIFAGSMAAIRNPKAHANLEIDQLEAWEKIVLASHLMKMWDVRTT